MSVKPVIVYGASGYTGRLICEYLREYNVPFVAAGRDKDKLNASMASNVAGIETADYEVVTTEGDVESLTELFKGASVVCNTVGPFSQRGPVPGALPGAEHLPAVGPRGRALPAVHPRAARARARPPLGRDVAPGVVPQGPACGQREGAGRRLQQAADAGRPADRGCGHRGHQGHGHRGQVR